MKNPSRMVFAGAVIALTASIPLLRATEPQQTLEHAPTVEQCQADQKIWLTEMTQSNDQSFSTLGQRFTEMRQCIELDPAHNTRYYNTGSQALYLQALRETDFLTRHNLYDQFIEEDAEGKR